MPANWYKKGRGHRVLICQCCGIIATNPLPLLAMAGSAVAPYVIDKASEILGGGSNKKEKPEIIVTDSLDKPNRAERTINRVLYNR